MNTLEKRILLLAVLLPALVIAVAMSWSVESFRRSHIDGLLLRSHLHASVLREAVEKAGPEPAFAGTAEGISGRFLERLAQDPQIAYCVLENREGKILFSSDPSLEFFSKRERLREMPYDAARFDSSMGKAYEVSLPFFVEGEETGRIRVGFLASSASTHAFGIVWASLGILGGGMVLVFVVCAVFLRRNLITPIRGLCEVAQEIASGQFTVTIPTMPSRELGDLGSALEEMAVSLKMRDDAILDGYRELEEANLLLQRSYEEQERTGAELRRSQKMYLTLFENASDAIIISDQNDQVILFNRQAEVFFGLLRDEVVGKNLFHSIELVRGDVQSQYGMYRELLERGSYESELVYRRPGEEKNAVGWVRASVAQDKEGKFWAQAIIRDITREREIKENLEKSARELERLNRMKDSFLGLASHELKTPLTIISGYSDLILNEMASTTDETVLSMVRHIEEASARLDEIVRDMLDVSLLDSRRLPLRMHEAEPNPIVRQVAADFASIFSLRRQSLEMCLEDALPSICCDPVRLRQALGNLLGNAVKFTPDGGRITIKSRVLAEGKAGDQVEIVISDTGIGIGEQERHHIFDKFYEAGKIEEHFTGKFAFQGRGTGLGLTIAKGIIEMHGGGIWVESPGYDPIACPGSSFHILLPAAQNHCSRARFSLAREG